MRLTHVDTFTNTAFGGNPAAVCVLDSPAPDAWMQMLAAELNLSETAFVCPGADAWALRWFTPSVEAKLCGHATLATAHVLWSDARGSGTLAFDTLSGRLTAVQDGDGIALDFPAVAVEPAPAPAGLVEALGVVAVWTGRSEWHHLVEVADPDAVRAAQPDVARIADFGPRAVILMAAGSGVVDVVSRYFAPASGVPEDPVTGSAHCAIGPLFSGRLGRAEIVAEQRSRRGGALRVRFDGGDRVTLIGRAVTVARCELGAVALPPHS